MRHCRSLLDTRTWERACTVAVYSPERWTVVGLVGRWQANTVYSGEWLGLVQSGGNQNSSPPVTSAVTGGLVRWVARRQRCRHLRGSVIVVETNLQPLSKRISLDRHMFPFSYQGRQWNGSRDVTATFDRRGYLI